MFKIDIEGGEETMGLIEGQIQDLEYITEEEDQDTLGGEFIKWQVEDMRRQYPNLTHPDKYTYATEIWPRSRLSLLGTYVRKPKIKNTLPLARRPVTTLAKVGPSVRPVLRDELLTKFHDRMVALLEKACKWR